MELIGGDSLCSGATCTTTESTCCKATPTPTPAPCAGDTIVKCPAATHVLTTVVTAMCTADPCVNSAADIGKCCLPIVTVTTAAAGNGTNNSNASADSANHVAMAGAVTAMVLLGASTVL